MHDYEIIMVYVCANVIYTVYNNNMCNMYYISTKQYVNKYKSHDIVSISFHFSSFKILQKNVLAKKKRKSCYLHFEKYNTCNEMA